MAAIPDSLQPKRSGLLFGILAMGLGGVIALLAVQIPNPMILIAGALGLLAVTLFAVRVEWGVLALVAMVYTNLSDVAIRFHGAPSVAKAFVPYLLLLVLIRWLLNGKGPKGWLQPTVIMAAYGLVGFAGLLHATSFDNTLEQLVIFVKDVLFALAVIMILQRGETFRRITWVLLMTGAFLGSISVFQYVTGTFDNVYWGFGQVQIGNIVGETSDYRLGGPIGDGNYYAQIMLIFMPLAFDRLLHGRRIGLRLFASYALAVTVLTVVFTFSRGAFLGLMVMGATMVLFLYPRPGAILLSVVLGLAVLRFAPAHYFERVETILQFLPGVAEAPVDELSLRGRTSENTVAWQMFMDHPVLGVGLNNYNTHYQEYSRKLGLDMRREERSAHNLYLEIAAEQGLIGLGAFGVLLGFLFHSVYSARQRFLKAGRPDYARMATALGVAMVGYLIAAIFLHDAYPRYFWTLSGIILALPQVARHELSNGPVQQNSTVGH